MWKSTIGQGMRASMESFDQTWIDGLFWLAIGVEDTFSASIMKYLYLPNMNGRTNTVLYVGFTISLSQNLVRDFVPSTIQIWHCCIPIGHNDFLLWLKLDESCATSHHEFKPWSYGGKQYFTLWNWRPKICKGQHWIWTKFKKQKLHVINFTQL